MDIITKVAAAVESHLKHESSGHDWQHIYRVWQTAQKLAAEEGANPEITSLAALLHDMDDYKLTNDPTSEGNLPNARKLMKEAGISVELAEAVCTVLKTVGYSKSLEGGQTRKLEARLLADADMLDAMGAVGIARTFTYCGNKGYGMFDPESFPAEILNREQYLKRKTPSITHFFEKLLRLKDTMHTAAGKREAEIRHQRMVAFLENFFEETSAPQVWKDYLKPFR